MIHLTRYGRRELAVATAAAACAAVVLGWLFWPAAAAPVALWAWVLWFFRDPPREVPDAGGLFVSPADGRVSDITPVGPESPLGLDGVRIGVFMNIFDVHVNRSPCDATVRRIEHCAGAFLDARKPAASERNESATVHMTHVHNGLEYPVVVRQVAGLVARRIVTDLSEGQDISRGRRIGMIKFGSRLEVLVPRGLVGRVCVSCGQRVRAGLTVLLTAPDAGETNHE